jgi:hypothetical protein
MEFLFEVFLQFGLALLAVREDDSGYFPKIPRKVRALDVYIPIALILGWLSSLVAPSPLLVTSLNPWLSLIVVPCVASVAIACLCGWLAKRRGFQSEATELRHFTVSFVVAFIFAASRYLCLRRSVS